MWVDAWGLKKKQEFSGFDCFDCSFCIQMGQITLSPALSYPVSGGRAV